MSSLKVGDKVQLRWGYGWAGLNWRGFKHNGMKDPEEYVTIIGFYESRVRIELSNGYQTAIEYSDIAGSKDRDWLAVVSGPGGH
jgi:ribulose bisphosphate carboxylase small subunit